MGLQTVHSPTQGDYQNNRRMTTNSTPRKSTSVMAPGAPTMTSDSSSFATAMNMKDGKKIEYRGKQFTLDELPKEPKEALKLVYEDQEYLERKTERKRMKLSVK